MAGPSTVVIPKVKRKRRQCLLKVTPAMAAGIALKLWEMADMVKVLEDWEAERN
jgi:hypothetical protein